MNRARPAGGGMQKNDESFSKSTKMCPRVIYKKTSLFESLSGFSSAAVSWKCVCRSGNVPPEPQTAGGGGRRPFVLPGLKSTNEKEKNSNQADEPEALRLGVTDWPGSEPTRKESNVDKKKKEFSLNVCKSEFKKK